MEQDLDLAAVSDFLLGFDNFERLSQGNYALVRQDGKVGLVCIASLQVIVPAEFDSVSLLFEGPYALVGSGRNHGLYFLETPELLLELEYSFIRHVVGPLFRVQKQSRWGLFNAEDGTLRWKE